MCVCICERERERERKKEREKEKESLGGRGVQTSLSFFCFQARWPDHKCGNTHTKAITLCDSTGAVFTGTNISFMFSLTPVLSSAAAHVHADQALPELEVV